MKYSKLKDRYTNTVDIPFNVIKDRRNAAIKRYKEVKRVVENNKKQILLHEKAISIFDYIVDRKFEEIIKLFEDTISSGLMDLFNNGYRFKFLLDTRGKALTCDFGVNTGDYDSFLDIRMTQGSALKQLVGTIIRIIMVSMDDKMPDFIVMDEPLGGVDTERQVVAADFLKKVCNKFDLQLIVVTQSPDFAENIGNVSDLEELKRGRKKKSIKV